MDAQRRTYREATGWRFLRRTVRAWRIWDFPMRYCAVVLIVAIQTLIFRIFYPDGSGSTYSGIPKDRLFLVALLFCAPLFYAIIEPEFGGFMLVVVVSITRFTDSLHPLSIVPWEIYAIFITVETARLDPRRAARTRARLIGRFHIEEREVGGGPR